MKGEAYESTGHGHMTNFNKAVILHYNNNLPISCHIRNDSVDNFFSAELLGDVKLNISKGDPVVVGLLNEGGIDALGGSIVSANVQDGLVRTMIILADSKHVPLERRKAERLSTSLYGIVSKNNMVVSDICIKNISESGVCIYTNVDFDIDEQVEIDMIMQEEVGKFKCNVTRKMQRYGKSVYGLNIIHDEESTSAVKRFIEAVQKYYASLMESQVTE